jgi:hypothetical protein
MRPRSRAVTSLFCTQKTFQIGRLCDAVRRVPDTDLSTDSQISEGKPNLLLPTSTKAHLIKSQPGRQSGLPNQIICVGDRSRGLSRGMSQKNHSRKSATQVTHVQQLRRDEFEQLRRDEFEQLRREWRRGVYGLFFVFPVKREPAS